MSGYKTEAKQVHILVVEDDEVDLLALKRAFAQNKVSVPLHYASNGQVALDMLRGTDDTPRLEPTPRIILLDINMPVMNGHEFLEHLRADEELKSIHVFVMSTSNDQKDIQKANQLNVAGYIVKPLNFDKFVKATHVLSSYWQLTEMT